MRVFQVAAFMSPMLLLIGLWVQAALRAEGLGVVLAGLWVVFTAWRVYEMLVLRNWAHWAGERWRRRLAALGTRIVHAPSRVVVSLSPSLSRQVKWFLPVLDGATMGATVQIGGWALVVGVAARMAFAAFTLRRWQRGIQTSVVQSLYRVQSVQASDYRRSNPLAENQHTAEPLLSPVDLP